MRDYIVIFNILSPFFVLFMQINLKTEHVRYSTYMLSIYHYLRKQVYLHNCIQVPCI